jgi:hypothetical protein
LIISTVYPLESQTYRKSYWSFGIFGEYLIANHITDFSALPGVPNCCPKFTGGTGSGIVTGLIVQYRFYGYNNFFLRIGYQEITGNLSANEYEWIVLDDKLSTGLIQHNISTSFSMPFIEPIYKYNTIIGLSFSIGMNLSYLASGSYSQNEMLVKPENRGTFENGTRIRNVKSGTLEGTSTFLAVADLAIEYEINLDKHKLYVLTPRFAFNYGLNSLFKDEKWRMTYFALGISFKFNPYSALSNPLEPN